MPEQTELERAREEALLRQHTQKWLADLVKFTPDYPRRSKAVRGGGKRREVMSIKVRAATLQFLRMVGEMHEGHELSSSSLAARYLDALAQGYMECMACHFPNRLVFKTKEK